MMRSRSKYGATPQVVDGIRFASRAEARRYGELKLLQKAGEISGLELQPVFPLCVASSTGTVAGTLDGRVGVYRADFAYSDKHGKVVEDVKGMPTLPLAKWKMEHLKIQYGITVREIRYRR